MFEYFGYGSALIAGAWVTIQLALISLSIALLFGLLACVSKLSKNRVLRLVASGYTTLIRGVPDIVLMLLFFYGVQIGMNAFSDWLYDQFDIDIFIDVSAFVAGSITIGFIFGAYMAESFRGAYLSVAKGQLEAAYAFGMRPMPAFLRIQLPQMVRHAIPGIANNWQVLLKTTALVSVIGLEDMVLVASRAAKAEHEPFLFLIPIALVYLLLTALSELGFLLLQKKYSKGVANG